MKEVKHKNILWKIYQTVSSILLEIFIDNQAKSYCGLNVDRFDFFYIRNHSPPGPSQF